MSSHLRVLVWTVCLFWSAAPSWAGAVLKPNGSDAMPVFTRSVTATADISGQFARTTLVMVFQNESEDQIEADFIYTLPPGAVATYFAYWAGDEKVEAKIVEKKEAARIYEHLTRWVRDPALVEFTGKNTFRARISPIFADQDLKVEIRYVQVLQSSGDSVSYSVPIGPAAKQQDPLESVDATVSIDADPRILSVSNNYGVPAAKGPGGYQIAIKGQDYRPPKDLNVRITRKHCPLRAELRAEPGNGHFSLALTPDRSLHRPRVSISGVRVTQLSPARLPNVRAGQVILVSGQYKAGGAAKVTLAGESSSGRTTYSTLVDFGEASPSGIASKLWASSRMADLGGRRANRKAVVGLSFGYSLPSRYTSWLAVPKAETKGLEYENIEPKLRALAEKMADMVADGKQDSPEYRKLSDEFDELVKPFPDQRPQWLLEQALSDLRYKSVEKVVGMRYHGKSDASLEAALKERIGRLSDEIVRFVPGSDRADADRLIDGYLQMKLEMESWDVAAKLADTIVNGNASTAEGRALQARYDTLRDRMPSKERGYTVAAAAQSALWSLASQFVNERHKPKPNKRVLAELEVKVKRAAELGGRSLDDVLKAEETSWAESAKHREQYTQRNAFVNAALAGDKNAARSHLQRYRQTVEVVVEKDIEELSASVLSDQYEREADEYHYARHYGYKPAELKRIRTRLERLAKLVGSSLDATLKDKAARDAAYEALRDAESRLTDTARSLTSELDHEHPIRSRVERLRKSTGSIASELSKVAPKGYYTESAREYNDAADEAIAAWLEEQRVNADMETGAVGMHDVARVAKERQAAQENLQTKLYHIRGSVRGGDPLISVEAPEDALRVVAVLPDGDVKMLSWNPASSRWEARFDIPTGTPDGDYIVNILVILTDGTRQLSSVNYKVDNKPPSGSATATLCNGAALRLEVTPDEELARVVALLPWGERVELRRSSGGSGYTAIVPVPVAVVPGRVEFVLTDNAHNRASVFAEPR